MEDHVKIFFIGAKKIAKIMGLTQKEIAKKIIGVAGLKGTQGSLGSRSSCSSSVITSYSIHYTKLYDVTDFR